MKEKVLLSRNEAIAILEEHDAPLDQPGVTMRDLLHWCSRHREELPYTPVEIMRAFFPHNPQNIRDTL